MMDMEFPTIDPSDPLKLSEEEEELLHTLTLSFCHSALLHKHIKFLYSKAVCINAVIPTFFITAVFQ